MNLKALDFKKIAANVAGAAGGAFISNALTKAMPQSVKDNPKTLGLIKIAAGVLIPMLADGKVKGDMAEVVEGASYGLMVDGVFNLMKGFNFAVSGIGETGNENPAMLQTAYGNMLVPQSTEHILAGIASVQDAYDAINQLNTVSGDEIEGDNDDIVSGDEIEGEGDDINGYGDEIEGEGDDINGDEIEGEGDEY